MRSEYRPQVQITASDPEGMERCEDVRNESNALYSSTVIIGAPAAAYEFQVLIASLVFRNNLRHEDKTRPI